MRIVLDTNVLMAGIATHGVCEALLQVAFRDHTVLTSEYILAEVVEHLQDKFKLSGDEAQAVAEVLRLQSIVVTPSEVAPSAFEDQDDLPVLGTASAAVAEILCTGDKKLLALASYAVTQIVSPRELLDRLQRV